MYNSVASWMSSIIRRFPTSRQVRERGKSDQSKLTPTAGVDIVIAEMLALVLHALRSLEYVVYDRLFSPMRGILC